MMTATGFPSQRITSGVFRLGVDPPHTVCHLPMSVRRLIVASEYYSIEARRIACCRTILFCILYSIFHIPLRSSRLPPHPRIRQFVEAGRDKKEAGEHDDDEDQRREPPPPPAVDDRRVVDDP